MKENKPENISSCFGGLSNLENVDFDDVLVVGLMNIDSLEPNFCYNRPTERGFSDHETLIKT